MSELNFTHSNGNKVKLTTPDTLAANKTFKLPGADGTSGQAMVTDGSGALSFASMPTALYQSYAVVCDKKASNVQGGTPQTGGFYPRDLNHELIDPDNIVSLSSNHFVLQAGTYTIKWNCPFYESGRGATELVTVANSGSGGATRIAIGAAAWSGVSGGTPNYSQDRSVGWHRVTISSETYFQIRYQCSDSQATYGLGVEAQYMDSIYTVVEIFKEA